MRPFDPERLLLECAERKSAEPSISRSEAAVQRAKAYLRARFYEPVSLDKLARETRLSPFHLARSFTEHFGLPPHAYQNHLRIERARVLLRAGVSATDVAVQVGFSDQSHFIRRFKQICRVTPGDYARAFGQPAEDYLS